MPTPLSNEKFESIKTYLSCLKNTGLWLDINLLIVEIERLKEENEKLRDCIVCHD